jgi:hypothetical protein
MHTEILTYGDFQVNEAHRLIRNPYEAEPLPHVRNLHEKTVKTPALKANLHALKAEICYYL